jgi:hypothetical protein
MFMSLDQEKGMVVDQQFIVRGAAIVSLDKEALRFLDVKL